MQEIIQPDIQFGVEWKLLELLCKDLNATVDREIIQALVEYPDFHWGELLDQAIRHRMQYLLAYQVMRDEELSRSVPRYIRNFLLDALKMNEYTMEMMRLEVTRIVEALQQENVRFVATKGITFESTIYGGHGIRQLRDIDLMVQPEHNSITSKIMEGLGYVTGQYKRGSDQIVEHGRKEMIIYKLSPDHLPKFVRRTDDRFVRAMIVDVANSFTWTASEYIVPLEAAFMTIDFQPLPGNTIVTLPVFTPMYQFLFTILHFFREAWLVNDNLWGQKDVNLIKCADIILFLQAHPELCDGRFRTIVQQHEIVQTSLMGTGTY